MSRAVVYTRVSTEEQVHRTSLDSQEQICRDYCTREDIEIARVFTDAGASAKTTDRQAFKDMLKFSTDRANDIDHVVAYRLDRLARNAHDAAVFRAMLTKYGVTVRSATEPVSDDPTGRFMTTILSAIAELDNDVRGERSREGMCRIVERGGWMAKPPLGYRMGRSGDNLPILVEDPENADLVRALFRMVGDKGCSESDAWRNIRGKGLRSPRGGPLYRQAVHKMLRNPAYCGRIENALTGGRSIKGAFKPLIDEDLFDRTQLVLSGRSLPNGKRRQVNGDFPLRRFVRCGCCGTPLTGSHSRGRSAIYAYYHCRNNTCLGVNVTRDEIEKAFCNLLSEMSDVARENLTKFRRRVLEKWYARMGDVLDEQRQLKGRLKKLEHQRATLLDKLVDGTVSDDVYKAKEKQLTLDIALVKSQLNDAQLDEFDIEGALNHAEFLLTNPERLWIDANVEIRQRFQKLLFPEGLSYTKEGGFGTGVSSSVYELLGQIGSDVSQLAPPRRIELLFPG